MKKFLFFFLAVLAPGGPASADSEGFVSIYAGQGLQAYAIGRYPITNAQYKQFLEANPSIRPLNIGGTALIRTGKPIIPSCMFHMVTHRLIAADWRANIPAGVSVCPPPLNGNARPKADTAFWAALAAP